MLLNNFVQLLTNVQYCLQFDKFFEKKGPLSIIPFFALFLTKRLLY